MELLIKMLFTMSLVVFNVVVFAPVFNMTDETKQKAAFMFLAGFNVIATTAIVLILHPYMADEGGMLAFSGFVGGALIFVISTFPYIKK